ncbi:MAG: DUF4405 domain-containing protein [Deferribacterales bacterium]
MSKNILRKAVSMASLFSFIYLAFSGIVMYFTPAGRIAYWADWRIFGMNKTMYNQTHITISMLFLVLMVLHLWLNWKPLLSYMKNRSGRLVIFTKETILGFILAVLVVWGTLALVPPFGNILFALDDIKEDYEYSLGNPPYPHAELTTMAAFIKRMKFDEVKAIEILNAEGIKYTMEENLKTIANNNNTDPAHIFALLKPTQIEGAEDEPVTMYEGVQEGVDMSKYESMMGSGMGKKSVADAAAQVGISVEEALNRLMKYNIEADENDSLKSVGEEAGTMPMDIFIIIDSGVKPE